MGQSMSGTGGPDALYDATIQQACTWTGCLSFPGHEGSERGRPAKDAVSTTDILCTAPAAIVRRPGRVQTCAIRPPEAPRQHAGAGRQASNWLTTQVVSWLWADGLPAQLAVGSIISCALQPR